MDYYSKKYYHENKSCNRYCDYCQKEVKYFGYSKHLKTRTHKLAVELSEKNKLKEKTLDEIVAEKVNSILQEKTLI